MTKCFGKTLTKDQLWDRKRIFMFAKTKFNGDNPDPFHVDIMRSYYTKLTGIKDCQIYGPHWYSIGFQDSNPYSDLRALGMFGPL